MSERYLKITAAGQIHIKNIDTTEDDKNFLEKFMANSKQPLSVNQLSRILNLSLDDTIKLVENYVARNFIRDTIAPLNHDSSVSSVNERHSLHPSHLENRDENNYRLHDNRSEKQEIRTDQRNIQENNSTSVLKDYSQKQVIIIKHIPVPVPAETINSTGVKTTKAAPQTSDVEPAYDTTPIDVTDEAREKSFDAFMSLFGQKK